MVQSRHDARHRLDNPILWPARLRQHMQSRGGHNTSLSKSQKSTYYPVSFLQPPHRPAEVQHSSHPLVSGRTLGAVFVNVNVPRAHAARQAFDQDLVVRRLADIQFNNFSYSLARISNALACHTGEITLARAAIKLKRL